MNMNIIAFKCKKCGNEHYPFRTLCPKCHHNDFTTFPMPRNGKLLTYTHLHTLPSDYEVSSITLGIVELENGLRMTGQLEIEKPKIGMKVKGTVGVVRQDDFNKSYGMIFHKA